VLENDGAKDTRALRHVATRKRILQAAWQLARENGLAALSLRDLAHEVGMRAPSLYTYFSSKNALYDAMYADGVRQLNEAVNQRPKSSDPEQALRQRMKRLVGFALEDPVRFQLIDQRTIPGFQPSPLSFEISESSITRLHQDLDAAGIQGGRSADLWRALSTGLINQQISNDPGGRRWARLADDAVDMFLAYHGRRSTGTTREER
jgi:AcrR family transcriptional regulator